MVIFDTNVKGKTWHLNIMILQEGYSSLFRTDKSHSALIILFFTEGNGDVLIQYKEYPMHFTFS